MKGPVMCVVGARPNFMKMAPILRAHAAHQSPVPAFPVNSGQHFDQDMNDKLIVDLRLRKPDLNLGVGSHVVQTAKVIRRFEPALDEHKPGCLLVVGGVNSTLACTLGAVKKGIPVVHVEAGLRSCDRKMPEEINRVLTYSGGLQEESTALGVPCLTMRENTERPITVEQGANTMIGRDRAAVLAGVSEIPAGHGKRGRVPALWDGHAADLWNGLH